ncbi:MAG: Exopolysaccharide biosynthesis polyprenyl glycosylphosphotransferase [Parcubacteria group bacterium GW2011_GWA1_36_12]|nr:MAG: Exopolysaccharide biosynthesis polyprenyl glycosylphosphotransferase [Parcubacteria group bacterium GW2011_GWA1_36_12]
MSENQKKLLANKNFFLLTLIFSDVIAATFAFFTAYFLRNQGPFRLFLDVVQPFEVYLLVLPFAVLFLIAVFVLVGLYDAKIRRTKTSEMYAIFRATAIWILLIMSASYLSKYDYSRIIVGLFYISTIVFLIFFRFVARVLQNKLTDFGFGQVNIVIIGTGKEAQRIAIRLKRYRDAGFNFLGFISNNSRRSVLGKISKLPQLIKKEKIDEIYIADNNLTDQKILSLIARCSNTPAKFKVISNTFELIAGNFDIAALESIPSLDLSRSSLPGWKSLYKRIFDIIFSLLGIVLTLPIWILISLAIKLDSSGNAIIVQKRVGRDGRIFNMYKFRTLRQNSSLYENAPKSRTDRRITKVGRFLRRTSLDELPQLVNILEGEMSLVGPRPEMPFKVKKYNIWEKRRLAVKPGLTGLWQILGREDLPLSENLEYDFYYINNQSLFLDIVILLKTIPVVITGKGAY